MAEKVTMETFAMEASSALPNTKSTMRDSINMGVSSRDEYSPTFIINDAEDHRCGFSYYYARTETFLTSGAPTLKPEVAEDLLFKIS